MGPSRGALLAPATPLDGGDVCLVNRYLRSRAHRGDALARVTRTDTACDLCALYAAPLPHTQSRASHRICYPGVPPAAGVSSGSGRRLALALGDPLLGARRDLCWPR